MKLLSKISIKCLILFQIFGHWTADVKKNINLTSPDYEERCDTIQKK